ncbi:MAG: DUF296 domain-containing protein [Proteobacteria bacterium]|nr:DUF296 domain-containing protein [Pseudomonadota bacterium]
MTTIPLRLVPGDDLQRALEAATPPGGGFVVCGIGSLVDAHLRFADKRDTTTLPGPFEILTLAGTLSPGGAHLHMTVADSAGAVYGGHVSAGNVVRTTAEVLIAPAAGWTLDRAPDAHTGYRELVVQPGTGETR